MIPQGRVPANSLAVSLHGIMRAVAVPLDDLSLRMNGLILLALLWLGVIALLWLARRRGLVRTAWHLDVAALGLLALAALGFFWRVLAGQNWMPADGGDLVSFLYPSYRFAASTLRAGEWPLWNPYLYGGVPHLGDIQAGFLYPPNLLLFKLWPDFPYVALQNLTIAHIAFAGAGMYLLLARGLRLGRIPAIAAALAFMFSDFFLTHFGNLNLNAAASWLPWVFWPYLGALNATAHARPLSRPALAGLLLGVATLAGHIQATLFIALALAMYTLLWLVLARNDPFPRRRAARAAVSLGFSFLVAFLLAAPILLPAFQLSGLTARTAWNYTETAGYSLSPAQWIGWLIPGFFGRGPQFHWGAWPRVEVGYIGILPLLLAVLAFALRRDRRTWLWAGLGVTSFVVALGIYAIPHGWLTLLPGFDLLRAPARFILVTDFALAILAAIGLDAVLRPLLSDERAALERVWRVTGYAVLAVWAIIVPLAYAVLLLVQDRDPAVVTRTSITLIAVMTFAGLLLASFVWLTARRNDWAAPTTLGWLAVALIYLDLAGVGAYQDLGNTDPAQAYDRAPLLSFLHAQPGEFRIDTRTDIESVWQPDTALLGGLEDVGGVANPSALADSERYWEGLGSRSSALYDLLNVRYVIAPKDVVLDWDKFAVAFDGDPDLNVYENRRALPRAFTVGNIQSADNHEAAWAAIHYPTFDPSTTAVLEGAAPFMSAGGQVVALQQTPNRVQVDVAAPGPTLLVISQPWYPGWQVTVDGAPRGAPLRADYLFQAVPVEAGNHRVELRFAPPLWRTGWLLALLGAVLMIAGLVYRRPST